MDTNKTPIEDLVNDALEHYEEASSKIHHWNSLIPKALRFYKKHYGQHETIVNCTPSEKAIEIADMNDSFDNKILMVLSSHITHGSSEGALVSAKEFDQISQDMKYLFKRCN